MKFDMFVYLIWANFHPYLLALLMMRFFWNVLATAWKLHAFCNSLDVLNFIFSPRELDIRYCFTCQVLQLPPLYITGFPPPPFAMLIDGNAFPCGRKKKFPPQLNARRGMGLGTLTTRTNSFLTKKKTFFHLISGKCFKAIIRQAFWRSPFCSGVAVSIFCFFKVQDEGRRLINEYCIKALKHE